MPTLLNLADDPLTSESLCDFPTLFRAAVARWPNSLAVQDDSCTLTFTQLDEKTNRIANFLINHGLRHGETVGLCVKNSALAIAAMIGIMKAGGVFVPLDPDFPADRIAFMAGDSAIQFVFCEPAYRNRFDSKLATPENLSRKLFDPDCVEIDTFSDSDPCCAIDANHLAYIMYTSGSTGMPKGVQIEHRALAAYCFADIEIYQLTSQDRTLQFGTLNFDIAIEEIFPPLLVGSSVIVRPRERVDDEIELSAIIRASGITALHVAAAYWHEWVDLMHAAGQHVPASLRLVIVTGEKVSPVHYQRWLSLVSPDQDSLLWCNAYGPTETTVTATVFIPPKGWSGDNMPIGKPLKRYSAYILDPKDRPLDSGETGELYIGGEALARGYLNRPDKNAEAFREVRFPDGVTRRIYKTGDLARWLPSGDIEFAGRIDHQIKLGSYRIEPQEIEHHLALHPRVREALVCCDEIDGRKCLTAYIACGTETLTPEDMIRSVSGQLPDYMIPHRYIFVESFPKTINGKIDRRSLPAASSAVAARTTNDAPPKTDTQRCLAAIFADVLQLESIGIYDDFFELGGSSLLVTRVISQVRKHFDMPIPVRDFFANPTVAMIATLLDRRASRDHSTSENSPAEQTSATAVPGAAPSLPTPDPFFFQSSHEAGDSDEQARLFAVHYPPCAPSSRHAVLICSPEGNEYVRSHRNLQQLALLLSRVGVDVLRFDFAAHGNSGGDGATAGPDRWQRDILDSLDMLRKLSQPSRMTVVAMRLGATLVANTRLEGVDDLILVDPVLCGDTYLTMLEEFDDKELTGLNRFDRVRRPQIQQLHGQRFSAQKYNAISKLHLPSVDLSGAKKTLVITSHRYEDGEGLLPTPPTWKLQPCRDEIGWHRQQFTHAAFASADLYRNILKRVKS
jgi:amino acid adenylation domain-containing protein